MHSCEFLILTFTAPHSISAYFMERDEFSLRGVCSIHVFTDLQVYVSWFNDCNNNISNLKGMADLNISNKYVYANFK